MAIEVERPHPHSYVERSYRALPETAGLAFAVKVEESDLWINIQAPAGETADFKELAHNRLLHYRAQLVNFLERYPDWGITLKPVADADYPFAPALPRQMMAAAKKAGVGPLAAVAGALAEAVGLDLAAAATSVVVENGGDIFLAGKAEYRLAIFAGSSPLSGRLGIRLKSLRPFSCGVCTSSGRVGHSLSFGQADAVTIVAGNTALADAVATAMANKVSGRRDLAAVVEQALAINGVTGAVAVLDDKLSAGGQLELIEI